MKIVGKNQRFTFDGTLITGLEKTDANFDGDEFTVTTADSGHKEHLAGHEDTQYTLNIAVNAESMHDQFDTVLAHGATGAVSFEPFPGVVGTSIYTSTKGTVTSRQLSPPVNGYATITVGIKCDDRTATKITN